MARFYFEITTIPLVVEQVLRLAGKVVKIAGRQDGEKRKRGARLASSLLPIKESTTT